jgi:hypothetical protein
VVGLKTNADCHGWHHMSTALAGVKIGEVEEKRSRQRDRGRHDVVYSPAKVSPSHQHL